MARRREVAARIERHARERACLDAGEDAPDRVRCAALVMRSATAGPILAGVLTARDATPSR